MTCFPVADQSGHDVRYVVLRDGSLYSQVYSQAQHVGNVCMCVNISPTLARALKCPAWLKNIFLHTDTHMPAGPYGS